MNRRPLSPYEVARRCMRRAWANDTDDRSRRILETASITIENLMHRLTSNAKCLEIVEAELASRRWPLLDDNDPGAAL